MKFLNHDNRLTMLAADGRGIDVNRASDGELPSVPPDAFERWADVVAWASAYQGAADITIEEALIGPPSPQPRQTLGVGLNYAAHAAEGGAGTPELPMIFPKLLASTAGPYEEIPIWTDTVDWEVELAVVIGRYARFVSAGSAWDHVAGLTVGQDLSERTIQNRPTGAPQFSLGKSLPKFGPTGPVLVTLDEIPDPNDLELMCSINGDVVQRGNTGDLIFSVPEVLRYLTATTELYPGDVILTGTPAGIGAARVPPRFLSPGDVLESSITGLGSMRHTLVAERTVSGSAASAPEQP